MQMYDCLAKMDNGAECQPTDASEKLGPALRFSKGENHDSDGRN